VYVMELIRMPRPEKDAKGQRGQGAEPERHQCDTRCHVSVSLLSRVPDVLT